VVARYSAFTSGGVPAGALYLCDGLTGASVVPTKKQLAEAERIVKTIDWSKLDALTDEEIITSAKNDPDSSLPTEQELADFDLVIPAKSRRKRVKAAE
jgi:hypothetical protein